MELRGTSLNVLSRSPHGQPGSPWREAGRAGEAYFPRRQRRPPPGFLRRPAWLKRDRAQANLVTVGVGCIHGPARRRVQDFTQETRDSGVGDPAVGIECRHIEHPRTPQSRRTISGLEGIELPGVLAPLEVNP